MVGPVDFDFFFLFTAIILPAGGGREGGREGRREGREGREGERKGGREEGREGEKEGYYKCVQVQANCPFKKRRKNPAVSYLQ